MNGYIENEFGTRYACKEWHDMPVPRGVEPTAYLMPDGMLEARDCVENPPTGALAWMVWESHTYRSDAARPLVSTAQ